MHEAEWFMVAEHMDIRHKRRNNKYDTLNNGNEAHRKIQLGHVPDELVEVSDLVIPLPIYNNHYR
jgi:hypothetical protein